MDELHVPSFIQPEMNITIQDKRIGFGRRLGAALLDFVFVMIVSGILYFAVGSMFENIGSQAMNAKLAESGTSMEDMPEGFTSFMGGIGAISAITTVAGLLIGLLELFTGASPGKRMLGIQIARANGSRGNMSVWGVRWALKNVANVLNMFAFFMMISVLGTVANVVGFAYFVGCFFTLSSKRQALHDIIASTAVYKNEDVV